MCEWKEQLNGLVHKPTETPPFVLVSVAPGPLTTRTDPGFECRGGRVVVEFQVRPNRGTSVSGVPSTEGVTAARGNVDACPSARVGRGPGGDTDGRDGLVMVGTTLRNPVDRVPGARPRYPSPESRYDGGSLVDRCRGLQGPRWSSGNGGTVTRIVA